MVPRVPEREQISEPIEFDLDWLPEFKREVYRQVLWDFFEVRV